jgi:hypothetical protein
VKFRAASGTSIEEIVHVNRLRFVAYTSSRHVKFESRIPDAGSRIAREEQVSD